MQIKADFIRDWHDQLKEFLVNTWEVNISSVKDEDIPTVYFNAESRRIEPRSRTVWKSDIFRCPIELAAGWSLLEQKIINGEDLTPHLSKLIDKAEDNDLMLNDWGIHHLHLGTILEGDYIKRTGPLLFGFVTQNNFYAVNVYAHGAWTKSDIIEIIHRNWPELLDSKKVNALDIAVNPSDQVRKVFRNKHINSMIKVSDGTIYAPPGGGMMTNGGSLNSRIKIDHQHTILQHLQNHLELLIPELMIDLTANGYDGKSELEVKLDITEDKYVARFDKYLLNVVLMKK